MGKKGIVSPKTALELLDMYYLEARSYLVETAAILDRIERADGGDKIMADKRIQELFKTCRILTDGSNNRTEQFLTLLSK